MLKDKIIVITGSSSGIGRSLALSLDSRCAPLLPACLPVFLYASGETPSATKNRATML
jgi:hypothetical protein